MEAILKRLDFGAEMKAFFQNRVSEIHSNLQLARTLTNITGPLHIAGRHNPADIGTKAHKREHFEHLRELCYIKDAKEIDNHIEIDVNLVELRPNQKTTGRLIGVGPKSSTRALAAALLVGRSEAMSPTTNELDELIKTYWTLIVTVLVILAAIIVRSQILGGEMPL